MAKYRNGRINEEMKKEISEVIRNNVKDPRLPEIISITDVDVTTDLKFAKVFISIFAEEDVKEESLKILKKSAGFIRREVATRINLRHMPELLFNLDTSIDYGMKIDSILEKIKEND